MAEYKQYITQAQENGAVMISEDVVCAIVAHGAATCWSWCGQAPARVPASISLCLTCARS